MRGGQGLTVTDARQESVQVTMKVRLPKPRVGTPVKTVSVVGFQSQAADRADHGVGKRLASSLLPVNWVMYWLGFKL